MRNEKFSILGLDTYLQVCHFEDPMERTTAFRLLINEIQLLPQFFLT